MSSPLLRRASLVLNLVLALAVAGLAAHRFARRTAAAPVRSSSPDGTTDATADTARHPATLHSAADSPAARRRSIIDQLRAMGAPNDLLALVARVDFEVQWEGRLRDCKGDMNKLAAAQLEMNVSKDAAMRAALGDAGFKQWDRNYMLWEAMSTAVDVTEPEAEAIYALKKKLQQSQFRVEQARLDGTMDDAAINEAYDQAYAEYYANLRTVLGDERYAKSQQMDEAFVAGNLRHELAVVNPDDAQFQELFKIEQALKQSRAELDHQFQNDPSAAEYQAKLRALDQAHDLEYQRILGADAFATLQKAQDPAYTQMKKYETLWGLDDRKIDQVYASLQQFQTSVKAYQSQVQTLAAQGQGVDVQTIRSNVQKLAAGTQQSLQAILGPDGFDKLRRNEVFKFDQTPPFQRAPF